MKRLYTLGLLASCAMLCATDDALAAGVDGLNTRIKEALGKLDPNDNDDWTDAGLPRVERLRELSGEQALTRAMVTDAAPGYSRTNAHAAPSDTSALTSKQNPVAQAGTDTPIPVQIVKANEIGEPDAGDFLKSPATLSKEEASPNLTAGEAAANNTTSMYPEITAGGGGTPGNDDGPLIAEDETPKRRAPEPSELAEAVPDAFFLLDALSIVASSERYRRNGELQQLIRSYSIQQVQMRDLQGRLDARDKAREARQDDDAAKVA